MVRGWLLFSSLVISTLFRLWRDDFPQKVGFLFSDMQLSIQWYVYFIIEHVIAISYATCIRIRDNTPNWLLNLFLGIIIADFLYFVLFYRDEGIGFNLVKVIAFGVPLAYLEIKDQWKHLKR